MAPASLPKPPTRLWTGTRRPAPASPMMLMPTPAPNPIPTTKAAIPRPRPHPNRRPRPDPQPPHRPSSGDHPMLHQPDPPTPALPAGMFAGDYPPHHRGRARFQSLLPAVAGAHHLPRHPGGRRHLQRRGLPAPLLELGKPERRHPPLHQLPRRFRAGRHGHLRHHAADQARRIHHLHRQGRQHGRRAALRRRQRQALLHQKTPPC